VLTLINLQIYFLLQGSGKFESDSEGGDEYKNFFADRAKEIRALGPRADQKLYDFLEGEVFGVKRKELTAEQRRQKKFSAAQLHAIEEQAAREEAEEEEYAGKKSDGDDQQD
jgi:hypothetical protein